MGIELKFTALDNAFGSPIDRFAVAYKLPKKTLDDIIRDAASTPGLGGLELTESEWFNEETCREVAGKMEKAGLKITTVFPVIWDGPFVRGSIGSLNDGIRKQAVEKIEAYMDVARKVNCPRLDIWPGNDGYDYVMSTNYYRAWDNIVKSLREAASYRPEIKLAICYKMKEPRKKCYISTISKTLLLLQQVDRENVGVDLDLSHALMNYETPAENIAILQRFGFVDRIYHMAMADNYRLWDDMMLPASIHTLEYIEYLYWLDKINYHDWISFDSSIWREDPVQGIAEGIKWIKSLQRIADKMKPNIEEIIDKEDAIGAYKLFRQTLFGD